MEVTESGIVIELIRQHSRNAFSGIDFTFVERTDALADLINERKSYLVNILGAPEKNTVVRGACALKFDEQDKIAERIAASDCIFTSVGGKNLGDVIPHLVRGIELRSKVNPKPINIVTCENWKKPSFKSPEKRRSAPCPPRQNPTNREEMCARSSFPRRKKFPQNKAKEEFLPPPRWVAPRQFPSSLAEK